VEKNRVKIVIQGETFMVKGSIPPSYVKKMAEHVDKKMQQVKDQHPKLGQQKVLVLTCLNLADEVFKLQEEISEMESLFNEKENS